ncbi:MAG TPA: hypothetical protein VNM90_09290, partial [Haliangium sp.]|nr:hypothetical protein [Haliangium sp.]
PPIGVGMPGSTTRAEPPLVKNSNTTCLNGRPFRHDLARAIGRDVAFGGNDPDTIPGTYVGAFERPGVYTITIRGEGYSTLVLEMVEVTADECHVNTEQLTIVLEPIPA